MTFTILDGYCLGINKQSIAQVSGLFLFLVGFYSLRSFYRRRNMPPGPIGLPFIGNKHQMPAIKPWRTFEQLNKQYGMYFQFAS